MIENNTRRIKILEQMAQMLYREWFVNFHFPRHEKIEMVDSPLGPIPDGWAIEKVGNRFITVLGGTPSRSKPEFWEGGTIPWINSGEVNKLRVIEPCEFITSDALSKSSAKLMPKRATVVAITGATLGQVSLLEIESSANQSVVGIYDHEGNYAQYLYLTFTAIIEAIIKHASGGAQQHINKEIVNETKIVVPPMAVMNRFNEIVVPIFDLIASLFFKNATLRKTRDFLLPKLISGEITVNHLERSVSQTS
ncbi:MAG TPA: restriction endonuclease subunit S [Candidatus Acidoferrales bacterium]|nr:restriction endonuclease subunit S [Candidatus Acidoferrales bacterium]